MRWIINYIRSCFCRHEWELILDAEGWYSHYKVYRCKKCGFAQKYSVWWTRGFMNDLTKQYLHLHDFYSRCPDVFLQDCLGINLKWYQRVFLRMSHSHCKHEYEVVKRSNVLQLDDMGYALRLCICRCKKCGTSTQQWIDVSEDALQELETGQSVLLKWMKG